MTLDLVQNGQTKRLHFESVCIRVVIAADGLLGGAIFRTVDFDGYDGLLSQEASSLRRVFPVFAHLDAIVLGTGNDCGHGLRGDWLIGAD